MRLLTGLPETELGKDFPVGVAGLEKLSQDEGGELVELLDAGVKAWSLTPILLCWLNTIKDQCKKCVFYTQPRFACVSCF